MSTIADAASKPDMVKRHIREMPFEGPRRRIVAPKTTLLGQTGGLTFVWEQVD